MLKKLPLVALSTFIVASATYSCLGDNYSSTWGWFFYIFTHYIPISLMCIFLIKKVKDEYVNFLSVAALSYCISCSAILTVAFIIGSYNPSVYKPMVGILTVVVFLITMIPSCLRKKKEKK